MGLIDGFRNLFSIPAVERPPVLQTRSLESLIIASGLVDPRNRPWRRALSRDALGVPAVFKAVSLISNTVGSLSMEAYRNGAKLPNEDTPTLIKRPDPFTPPQPFYRDSAFYKALTGEHWWWIARRDTDDAPLALINIDPREITVEPNRRNAFRPIITWRGEEMRNDDMVQVMYLRDPENPLRGIGPLQACRAAVSVAVEAQEWAANWFAGSPSTLVIKSATELGQDDTAQNEAMAIKNAWMADSGNLPKVIDPGIESVQDIGGDPEKAQLSQSRLHQNGEIALMFSMPPTLLNYAVSGSTITYQNVGQVADDFLRQCLLPHYLEPMEQAMSDLLTRSTIGRFNVRELLRADIKTRAEVYSAFIDKGIMSAEEARQSEGMAPGDVENRPIPFAPPAAIPANLPVQVRSLGETVRCESCNRLLAEMASPPYRLTCTNVKCRHLNVRDADEQTLLAPLVPQQVTVAVPPPVVTVNMPQTDNEDALRRFGDDLMDRVRAEMRDLVREITPPPQPPRQRVFRRDEADNPVIERLSA